MSNYKYSNERDHVDKNHEERVTHDIEVSIMGKYGSQNNIGNVEKESYEENWMDMIDDIEYDETDQTREIKEDDLESKESETDEGYQLENPESLQRIDIKHNRDNYDPVEIYIELKTNLV